MSGANLDENSYNVLYVLQSGNYFQLKIIFVFANSDLTAYDLANGTSLFVGFKETTCLRYRRSVYMTWDILFGESITKRNKQKKIINFQLSNSSFDRWCVWFMFGRIYNKSN